jgi:hypothetical protein
MKLPRPTRLRRLGLLATFLLSASLFAGEKADVVVYGATPGGIATAVRAAREGLHVTLVHHHAHVGGMMVNGLGVLDTSYDGYRAPIFDELKAGLLAHYPQYQKGAEEYRKYEPHVAERMFETLLAAEPNITLQREWYPVAVGREGRRLTSVTFRRMDGSAETTVAAGAFVDASYEGDLAHVAGAATIIGRESRTQYGEPHAGRIFTKARPVPNPKLFAELGLNLSLFAVEANELLPGSTGEADGATQAYNFRVCWSRDPANRLPVTRPTRYERDVYLDLKSRWRFTNRVPNGKTSWNAPLLVGGNHDYPAGDWAVRREITARHRDLALGLLWFMQNDEIVPANIREEARQWGLPKDEFADNGGFPWEMYVREARRLVGRQVFTQHDGMAAPGLERAPVRADSIAITEWPLDSHSCTLDEVPGSDHEGKVLLSRETRPGQVSYQCLLPQELDNLLVTVCVSSSHIGWGTIRLEPVWMQIGESAGYALALAHRAKVAPADVPAAALRRELVENRVMLGLFNEFDMRAPTAAQKAAQYFVTQGFFPGYNAQLDAPLTRAVAAVWTKPGADANATARLVAEAERSGGPALTAAELAQLAGRAWPDAPAGPLTRGAACAWLYAAP